MGRYGQEEYRATITLLKVLVTALPAGAAGWLSTLLADLPQEAVLPAIVAAVVAGVYRGARNWLKQKPGVNLP
jgi:hypothetical protein